MINRGQSAIEFMILVGAVLAFFIGFLFAVNVNSADRRFEQQDVIIREVALTAQNEIALASASLDGYLRTFTLPFTIGGLDYEISVVENSVYVHTLNDKHAIALAIAPVSGDLQIGANTIRKEDGVVYLNG